MGDMKFVEGMRVFLPKANAPSFIKADLVLNVGQLSAWLSSQSSPEVRVQIRESKGGDKLFAAVNDYQPGAARPSTPSQPAATMRPPMPSRAVPPPFPKPQTTAAPVEEDNVDDIPFDKQYRKPSRNEVYPPGRYAGD